MDMVSLGKRRVSLEQWIGRLLGEPLERAGEVRIAIAYRNSVRI